MDRKQLSKNRKPELLAPAGDLARCKTAIRYGADAVYLGGQQFSLRSRASNFTMDDIREACAFAHEYGANIHVTVNVIPHEEDFDGLAAYVRQLEEAGVTAVIVASPAIMKIVKENAPKLEIHCSTQMSVTNVETAMFLKEKLQLDRVVLARECSLEDVRKITDHCGVDTEAFIHGGMCVNISGRCTLSNRMTLRDANRGGCAQSCRWFYRLYRDNELLSKDQLFTMGSKDLYAADEIAALMQAGVSSFKIEGRMKTEYYVASMVSGYRHLIDELYENDGVLSEERMNYHRKEILKGENRETCSGFYNGIAGSDSIISSATAGNDVSHDFLATVKSYDALTHTAIIESRNPIDLGDCIEVLSPGVENRRFTLEGMRNERDELMENCRRPMSLVKIPVPFEVGAADILRRYDDAN